MKDPHAQFREALGRIRRTTVGALSDQPRIAKAAAAILRDADVVEEAVRELSRNLSIENPRAGKPRKAVVISHYTVEHMPSEGGDALAEHRTTGAQPFRCPKDVYSTAAKALGSSITPLKFEEFQKQVEAGLKREVPIYQLRLALRFWSFAGLLDHRRARFAPRDGSSFPAAAGHAWSGVVRRPLHVG